MECRGCDALAGLDVLGGAVVDDCSAFCSGLGSYVDDPFAGFYDFGVVFDDEYAVASVL